MIRRPRSIIISALFFAFVPIFYIGFRVAQAHWYQQATLTLSWPELVTMLTSWVVAYGIYKVRLWGYYFFLALSVSYISIILKEFFSEPKPENYLLVLGASFLSFFVALFLQKHVAAPYFNPRIRWWETAPRIITKLAAHFKVDGTPKPIDVLDLSRTGAFVTLSDEGALSAGDLVYTHLVHRDISLDIMSRVVRFDTNRKGYGLMFLEMKRSEKIELQKLLKYLDNQRRSGNDATPGFSTESTSAA